MKNRELLTEVKAVFREKGIPSHWIKLFRDLRSEVRHELLTKSGVGRGGFPLFGGAWHEVYKKDYSVGRRRMWLLVTSEYVHWYDGKLNFNSYQSSVNIVASRFFRGNGDVA